MESYFGNTICPNCGKEFEKKSPTHTFCSVECKEEAYRRGCETVNDLSEVPEGEQFHWERCETCGKYFKPLAPGASKKYCCYDCQYKAKKDHAAQYHRAKVKALGEVRKKPKKADKKKKTDGITWDEIRAVLAEEGISNYHEAVRIAEQRRKEREIEIQKEDRKR